MGLDMYLEAELYIGGRYEHRKVTGMVSINMDNKAYNLEANTLSSITIHIGYWRKANAIHGWFVKHVQDGVDECQRAYVSREKLTELLHACTTVLEDHSKAEELLPTQSGFFFGSTEMDEWYFQDLKDTVDIIEKALELPEEYYIYYHSSW